MAGANAESGSLPQGEGAPAPAPVLPGSDFRRILLVGFMGTGKSTIGAGLARKLGWEFLDSDRAVEAKAGKSVPQIFESEGEEAFRLLEDEVVREALSRTKVVISTGGGWPCRPGRMESIGEDTLTIWLRTDPRRILARVKRGRVERPLLKVEEPLRRIRELLGEREPFYRRSLWWADTGVRSPAEVVRLLLDRLRKDPGRPLRG